MSPEEYIPALQHGRSALLSGFKSKEGKAFDAYLVWDAKAKKFSFAFLEKKSTYRRYFFFGRLPTRFLFLPPSYRQRSVKGNSDHAT